MSHRQGVCAGVVFCAVGIFALLIPSQAQAAGVTRKVDCNAGQTIAAEIAKLNGSMAGAAGPNTLLVSGTCNENITIVAINNLTIQGNPTATVNGNANDNGVTLWVVDSQNFTMSNMTLSGESVSGGVYCAAAICHLISDTIENSVGAGVAAGPSATVFLESSIVQQNAGAGVRIGGQGSAVLAGATVQSNGTAGVYLQLGGSLVTTEQSQGYILTGPAYTVIQNNAQDGIFADINSVAKVNFANIIGNTRDGVRLAGGAKLQLASASITGNTGHGVRIGDLAFAEFVSDDTVSGNNSGTTTPLDVVCDPQYSATRGLGNLAGTTTNCPAEPPTTP